MPSSVTVASGNSTATFTITTSAVNITATPTITATCNGTATATLTVNPPMVTGFSLSPASLTGGTSSTGSITLNYPAPAGGATVTLSNDNIDVAQVQASVTVASGNSSATFTISTSAVSSTALADLTASYNGTQTATLTINSPVVSGVSLSPATLVGGVSSTGTITLSGPAPAGGMTVTLSNNNGAAQLPTSVTIAAGLTTANFTVTTSIVSNTTSAIITASPDGTQTATLTINTLSVSSVSLNPATLIGGNSCTATVTLNGAAPAGNDVSVALASDNAAAQVPASVTVPAGASSATFSVSTSAVGSTTNATIGATYVTTSTATLTIGAAGVSSLILTPSSLTGGSTCIGTVGLTGAAPTGGMTVALSIDNSAVAQVPASVTVAAGTSSATFTMTASMLNYSATANITATCNGAQTTALTVIPLQLNSLTVDHSSVLGGTNATGTVTLNGPAPAGGVTITLQSGDGTNFYSTAAGSVPASVTVAATLTQATFTVTTNPVLSPFQLYIGAGYNGTQLLSTLSIIPPTVTGLSLNPSILTGGATSTATITLNGPAPAGGLLVVPSSDNADAIPNAVTVVAGATTASFTVTTCAVDTQVTMNISVGNADAQSARLTIIPPVLTSVTLNPGTVTGSLIDIGTVTLSGPAPADGAMVMLDSDNLDAAFTYPFVQVPPGNTSADFNIYTYELTSAETADIAAAYNGAMSVTLTVAPPPSVSAVTLDPAEIIGSSAVTGTVTLSAPAPAEGATVILASDNAAATPDVQATVPGGQTSITFNINTVTVAAQTTANISADYNGAASAPLTIDPPAVASVSLVPSTLIGGDASTGTVTLNIPAPDAGIVVTLSSDNANAQPQANVTVPGGASSATFSVTTSMVTNQTIANISASCNGTVSAALTLNTPGINLLYLAPTGQYVPIPTPFYVANGVPVTFMAVPDPPSYAWQTSGLSWTGATPGDDPTIATATFTADGTVTVSYGTSTATASVTAVSVALPASPPYYVGVGVSLVMPVTVTPSDAPVQFSVLDTDYAEFDNWDAVDAYLTLDGIAPGDTQLLATLPDGTLITSAALEAVSVVFTPSTLAIADNGTAPVPFTVAVLPDDAPVSYAIADTTCATLGGTAPNMTITGLAAGVTRVQAMLNGVEINNLPVTVGSVLLNASPYLLADGQDNCQLTLHLLDGTGAPAANQQVTLTTTDGVLYAVGDIAQNGAATLTVTTDSTGAACAMLQSSTTPGVNTVTGSYTDAGGTLRSGTATVTFFLPSLQTSAVVVPGENVPPLYAVSVGAATDTVSVILTTTPPIDLTQVQINWSGSDGVVDSTDPSGATLLVSRAASAPMLANVSAAVTASVTTATCPAQVAVLRVTGVGVATSDASGLYAADSNGNLVTGVQAGVTATVQASVLPAVSALQQVYGQFLYWSSGAPGATGGLLRPFMRYRLTDHAFRHLRHLLRLRHRVGSAGGSRALRGAVHAEDHAGRRHSRRCECEYLPRGRW